MDAAPRRNDRNIELRNDSTAERHCSILESVSFFTRSRSCSSESLFLTISSDGQVCSHRCMGREAFFASCGGAGPVPCTNDDSSSIAKKGRVSHAACVWNDVAVDSVIAVQRELYILLLTSIVINIMSPSWQYWLKIILNGLVVVTKTSIFNMYTAIYGGRAKINRKM